MSNRVLAVDCSLRLTGVALVDGERIVACEIQDLGRRQSAELPVITQSLLREVGWAWSDINLLAVTSGPGYFTGLRVGAAYATGLTFALGLKIVPVSSLEMLALSSRALNLNQNNVGILAIAYAGRDAVYAASYYCGDNLPLGEYTGDMLSNWLARPENANVIIVSDDSERAASATGVPEFTPRIKTVRPNVACVALAAQGREAIPPETLRLTYCRMPV